MCLEISDVCFVCVVNGKLYHSMWRLTDRDPLGPKTDRGHVIKDNLGSY